MESWHWAYLGELMEHTGHLAGIRALGVVVLCPPALPVTATPGLLLPLVAVGRDDALRVGGRAKGGGGTGQKGKDSRQGLWPPVKR